MKVAILGFARQGISAYDYYKSQGAEITICDQNEQLDNPPKGAELQLGKDHLKHLERFDLLVRTPVLAPNKIEAANPDYPNILDKVTTASNEFLAQVKTPIIAVTGTKGKGTTCMLSQAILEAAGLKVALVGNIGIAPLAKLGQAQQADVVVFEIASFQTIDLKHSPQVGVCLKMSPEHLDWHPDYQDYLKSKSQLFANQKEDDKAIFLLGDQGSEQVVSSSKGRKLGYSPNGDAQAYVFVRDGTIYVNNQPVAKTDDIKLIGKHSHQNVCAAIAASYDFLPAATASQIIIKALHQCHGFPSRLEKIAKINGVSYINDSFASAPEASIAALEAVAGPKILIVGGHDKGVDMATFVDKILVSDVKHLIAIGATGQKIVELIKRQKPDMSISDNLASMAAIVANATEHATAGDTVLLSTGSASFGMFKDVFDRAEQFKQAVSLKSQ